MFHRSEDFMRIVKNELANQGVVPSDDVLERIRVCIDELKEEIYLQIGFVILLG
jgi:hypothetical protein